MSETANAKLVVKTKNLPFIMLVILGLILVPMAAALSFDAVRRGRLLVLIIAVVVLALYAVIVFLFVRAYRRSVKYFESTGLVRNDGTTFLWTDLVQVVERTQLNRATSLKGAWRFELEFKMGAAWLLPTKIANLSEVLEYVRQLPVSQIEKRS